ncbi:MAG: BREX-2 system adenine-specific DNA-methyltransferase PglX, partial [Planctomycetota bacterium]|nr:BREX-2 system adenine-specific DNA-methyltransferase PglX [Planctomycetota bacterium]
LDSVHGVDLNPYAVAIARFRLLLAAMRACGIGRLADAPPFRINLACGDSLLHGSASGDQMVLGFHELAHAYRSEDLAELRRILRPGIYHAVVANPPYITPKDKALNQAYRDRYSACHRQYSLAVPFMQRLFDLAISGQQVETQSLNNDCSDSAGYVGQITANSFMKREFGKRVIEQFLPRVDLTHVIDTSGAYIPGHGTPTVILLGRTRKPVTSTIRTVMGIRGEPSTPDNPSRGQVWSAILAQIDRPGSQSEFVSVADSERAPFQRHPWSIGGGGAAELKDQLDERGDRRLLDVCTEIGFGAITRDDDVFVIGTAPAQRLGIERQYIHNYVVGEQVRDWSFEEPGGAIWPYAAESLDADVSFAVRRFLWRFRRQLCDRVAYGHTQLERGLEWFEYSMFFKDRFRSKLLLTFACVATHNNFVLSPGGVLFNRHAPVIKLPPNATEDDHVALLGMLNSSTACFWMKQVFHNKGSSVDQRGARQTTVPFENFWEHDGTKLKQFPLPTKRPLALARRLCEMAGLLSELSPSALLRATPAEANREVLAERRRQWEAQLINGVR